MLGLISCHRVVVIALITQENVQMMSELMDISQFSAIYVVDLCGALCKVAKSKVAAKGWTNVHVVESDACTFVPPEGVATLITFSYSLTSTCIMWQQV